MSSFRMTLGVGFALSATVFLVACASPTRPATTQQKDEIPVPYEPVIMKITSSAFTNGGMIPLKYTCDGENVNPPLSFSGIPKDARSLVLIMEDPDVPISIREDGMWDHWVVFDIPATLTRVEENQQPSGISGKGSTDKLNYKGPCPPAEHRYYLKLFALDAFLYLPEGSTKSEVMEAMEGHVISEAELMGRYDRTINE